MIDIGFEFLGKKNCDLLWNRLQKNIEDYDFSKGNMKRGINPGKRRPMGKCRNTGRNNYNQRSEGKSFDSQNYQYTYNWQPKSFADCSSPKHADFIPGDIDNQLDYIQKDFERKSLIDKDKNIDSIIQPLNYQQSDVFNSEISAPSIMKSIELLNADVLTFINTYKGGYEEIIAINELLSEIKQFIKQKSPTTNIRLIGSAFIGTYIKDTDVDIIYNDFLSPDPMTLLISSISQLNLGQVQELNQNILYFLPNHSPPFKFLINDELTFELSSLIKAYCKIDSRCVELIILSKL